MSPLPEDVGQHQLEEEHYLAGADSDAVENGPQAFWTAIWVIIALIVAGYYLMS